MSGFEVFMRYVFDAPNSWTSEVIMMLVATAWLLCVGAVTQQRRHITVTTLALLVPNHVWERMKKLAVLFSLLGVAGLIMMLWDPMLSVLKAPQTSGSAFDPPTPTYIKTMFVVASSLYFLQLCANLMAPAGGLLKESKARTE